MNQFEFGTLVASLREDMRWTQLELAEKSGIDVAAISNIERGTRKSLQKDNLLVKLADGFRLTTLERHEFLFAASGVTEKEAIRKDKDILEAGFDSQQFIKSIGEHIARIHVPVMVTDAFCDTLLVNRCILEYYNFPLPLLDNATKYAGGFNQMRYVFHVDSNFKEIIGPDKWDMYCLINARYFRRRSLRVRYKKYFSELLGELLDARKYPYFELSWRRMLFESHDDYYVPFNSPHPDDIYASYAIESLLALTPYGEVYLQQILPLNKKTSERINKIMNKVGEGYVPLAPFPDTRKR